MSLKSLVTALAVLLAQPMHAEIVGTFDEGAPKDRFTFLNAGDCTVRHISLFLDLSGSSSGLVFDVTSAGAGVEVFQPLELVAGEGALNGIVPVKDGDNTVMMNIKALAPGHSIAFTIDVDDTMGQREITVSGSEIEGATFSLADASSSSSGTFASNARASAPLIGCSSSG
ncbi:MAG: aggregation factor core [Pseudomonadota bacterium]